ncbi:MAG: hypothetical protein VYA06_01205 [Chloroflexota bacterium]|nr:hypothetical protein [Chloroflexota bacterium]
MKKITTILVCLISILILSCGSSDVLNFDPDPTPTPVPTPTPDGYSDTIKELFLGLCTTSASEEFCECSVNQIEENIPVQDFPVEPLMEKVLSGEIDESSDPSGLANIFPAEVMKAVAPCFELIEPEEDIKLEVTEEEVEDLKLPENTDDLSKEDLLAPITELCLIQGSPKFCECTKETVADNYTDDELLELRKELEKGSLPPELIQLGMMNCAIYIGQ